MTSDQSGEARSNYGFGMRATVRAFSHGGAYNTMTNFDRGSGLITVFLGQHAGWIKDGKTIVPAFQKAAAETFGRAGNQPAAKE